MLLINIMGKGKNVKDARTSKQKERNDRRAYKKREEMKKNYDSPEEKQFAENLDEFGLRIKVMDGDGNCLFRALADQISGDSKEHFVFRRQIMDYIESNHEHFSLFIEDDEPFGDYVSRMRTPGEWGGNPELYAASQCLHVNIYVHQVDSPIYILTSLKATRDIHVSYHGECHYNSVRSKKDPDVYGEPPIPIDIKNFVVSKKQNESESRNTVHNETNEDETPSIQQWSITTPDFIKFMKDSYEVIEDWGEEVLEIASSLTGATTAAVVEDTTKGDNEVKISEKSPQETKSRKKKSGTEETKEKSTLSKKESRKAGKQQSKETTEPEAPQPTITKIPSIMI